MAVKRYKAKSIQEAINRIKEDFGPDAMILSTRRLPKTARNPYEKELFEETAALRRPIGNSDMQDANHADDERQGFRSSVPRAVDAEAIHAFDA